MLCIRGVLAGLLLLIPSPAGSEPAIFKTLICEFANDYLDLAIEADLKSERKFFEEASYTSGGVINFYSLSQKVTTGNQLYHFVLNEGTQAAVSVRVFKSPGDEKLATATFEGVKPKPATINGDCILL